MEEKYSNACVEVIETLNNLTYKDYKKIPKEYIIYLKKNANKNYKFKYDTSKSFQEQELSVEAKLILFFFFEEFSANKEQQEKIRRYKLNIMNLIEKNKAEKFNRNELFDGRLKNNLSNNDNNKKEIINNELMIHKNKSLLSKIIGFIKNIFIR